MSRFLFVLFLLPLLLLTPTHLVLAAEDPSAQPNPQNFDTSGGKDLFNCQNQANLTPYGDKSTECKDESQAAESFEKISSPFSPNGTTSTVSNPCGSGNVFEALVKQFKEFWARFFKGVIGTGQTVFTAGENIPKPCVDKAPDESNRSVQAIKRTLLPAGVNPNRITSGNASAININAQSLRDIINTASSVTNVPAELLMAISQTEAPGAFGYSEDDVKFFSSDGWWSTASYDKLRQGYCYNTCEDPAAGCPGSNVVGAMQFEIGTWDPLLEDNKKTGAAGIKSVLASSFGSTTFPNRCNLRDSIVAAAVKIREDSQNSSVWDENTVKYKVAQPYCGSCQPSRACGPDYCGNVWRLFNSYKNLQP